MSDFRDTVKSAIENGFYLDSCGSDERHKSWGLYTDLCGMAVEDAIPISPCPCGGGGEDPSAKTKNTITFSMIKNGSDEYELNLSAAKTPDSDVVLSFIIDGNSYVATIPAGVKTLNTGIKGENPNKPYATIENITISSDSELYDYKSSNSVKTGIFTLTVVIDGSSTSEQVKYGTEYTLPEVEQREGYDFTWKDNSGEIITGATYTMPESDTTISGTYAAKTYVLTYNIYTESFDNDVTATTESGTIEVKFGEKVLKYISALTPTIEGHTLSGWAFENGEPISQSTTMPATDSTVENRYVLNKYTLKYIVDGTEFRSEEYYFGQNVTAISEEPIKEGYTFNGWDTEIPSTMPSRNVEINALFTVNQHTITYYVDGVVKYTDTYNYGDSISIRGNEEKEGYTFSGWDTELPATMPDNDINVNGTFSINTYTLSCENEGETIYSRDYEYGSSVDSSEIPTPSKEGYTFTGWDKEIPSVMPANNVVLISEYEINQYSLNYYVDGTLFSSIIYDYGAEITPIDEPSKEGYTFSGWDSVPSTMPAGDVDVNGTFTVNQYTLNFILDGAAYTSLTGDYGTEVPAIETPSREGYTFSGWDSAVPTTFPAENITFNGALDINVHTVTYFVDGTVYSAVTYEFGETIVPIAEPSREGYTFSGWGEIPVKMPDNDVDVNGTFTINQYTIKFVVDSETYTSLTGDYNTAVPEITTPSKEGYTFSGWDKEIPIRFPADDIVISGTFSINSYIASYVIDGEPYSSATYEYGQLIVYPDVPKSGYTLNWAKEYQTMPASSITINGTYVEVADVKTIYYGAVLRSEQQSFDDPQSLSSYEYVNNETATKTFVIPMDEGYAYAEENLEEDEFEQWCAEHEYSLYLTVPKNAVISSFTDTLGGDLPLTEIKDISIDGAEYKAYASPTGTPGLRTEQLMPINIVISKTE